MCSIHAKEKEKERKKSLPKPGIIQNSYELSGLNQGPSDLQSDALPTELFRQVDIFNAKFTMKFRV